MLSSVSKIFRGVVMCRVISLFFLILIAFFGCEQTENVQAKLDFDQSATKPTDIETKSLLQAPIEINRYEVPSQALAQWHKVHAVRPALLLYCNNPLLLSIRGFNLNDFLNQLDRQGEKALSYPSSNPAILPEMTLDVAREAGFFSAIYWVIPTTAQQSELSIETFRQQIMQFNALNAKEAASLTYRDGIFSGQVRGVPFYAIHPDADFSIEDPAVFHFDLSYLVPLYQGEIKTPTFSLLYETLKKLRERNINVVSAGFSYSQLSLEVALGSRFLGNIIEQIFLNPSLLDQSLPASWKKRADAPYMAKMFLISDSIRNYIELVKEYPSDPSLHYSLYQLSRELNATRQMALQHLSEAVKLDPVYALEYLSLAPLAQEKSSQEKVVEVLRFAHEALPDNPFISLDLSQALLESGLHKEALFMLEQLESLTWSEIFFPTMPELIEDLIDKAKSP